MKKHTDELKNNNLAIQLERDNVKKLLDNVGSLILFLDTKGVVTLTNAKTNNILGYPPEDIIGKPWIENFVPERIREVVKTVFNQLISRNLQSAEYYENAVLTSGGQERLIAWHNSVVTDQNDQTVGILSSGEDITESRKAMEALEKSRQQFQALVENTSDFIWEVDANGTYTYCSPQIKELWGYTAEETIGKTPFERMPPEDRERALMAFREIAGSQSAYKRMETCSFDSAGQMVVVETSAVPFFDDHGQLIGYRGITRDMTENKRAEKAIQESEEKYRLLVENANEAVVVFQGALTKFFNNKMLGLTGYTEGEFKSVSFENLVHPDDQEMVNTRYRRRLQGEKVPSSYDFRINRKDASVRWVNVNSVLITWEDKPASLVLFTDVTERKLAEEARAKTQEQLERVNAQLKQFGHRITQVQEAERKRIAYELHDETAQYLSILKMQIGALVQSGKISDPG